jgi:hypothetical protein
LLNIKPCRSYYSKIYLIINILLLDTSASTKGVIEPEEAQKTAGSSLKTEVNGAAFCKIVFPF